MRLILTRHAKSDWDDPLLDDHDRPLNARGHRSAILIGEWLAAQGMVPDCALVSSALRAQETADGLLRAAGATPERLDLPALYLVGPGQMLKALRSNGRGRTCLMIGHNPGIAEFADVMAKSTPKHADFHRYPTAATTILDFPAKAWSEVAPGTGAVFEFITPRALDKAAPQA